MAYLLFDDFPHVPGRRPGGPGFRAVQRAAAVVSPLRASIPDVYAPWALRAARCACLRGTAVAIPRRAVLGAPCVAGQGLRPDRLVGFRSGCANWADVGVPREVSARGFAWREGWQRRVLPDCPAVIPAPGRCPVWPWPPGPGQSRALRAWVPDPRRWRAVRAAAGAGDAAKGCTLHRLRLAGVLSCAVRGPLRRPTLRVHRLRSGAVVSAWLAAVVMSVRPAVPVAGAVVSGLWPGRISRGTAVAIPRRAVLGAPCLAGQGLRPDRRVGPFPSRNLIL